MSKIVDGVELLRMIRDNEIEEGTKIKMYYDYEPIETLSLNHNDLKNEKTGNSIIDSDIYFIGVFASDMHKFKILEKEESEEQEEPIDIQAIEPIQNATLNITQKINELIKAVKQLDKKIK